MYLAEVIAPEEQLKFKCEGCELEYDCVDYHTLLKNKKLAYFTLGEVENPQSNKMLPDDIIVDCICHECLYTALKDEADHSPNKELKFKLVHNNIGHFSVINNEREGGFFS
tara:strand:- start:193 stop:525 length:333 start_codon:yes stop_codon:yes gene_type:complete